MKLADKKGNALFRKVIVKVFHPNGKCERVRFVPPRGRFFTEQGIDEVIESASGRIEANYPTLEFELVELSRAEFNIVYRGPKFTLATVPQVDAVCELQGEVTP